VFDTVSLLVGSGHGDATGWPLWYLRYEANRVAKRFNTNARLYATLNVLSVSAARNGKKAVKALNDAMEKLDGGQ